MSSLEKDVIEINDSDDENTLPSTSSKPFKSYIKTEFDGETEPNIRLPVINGKVTDISEIIPKLKESSLGKLNKSRWLGDNKIDVISSAMDRTEIKQWLDEFGKLTHSHWIFSTSAANGHRLRYECGFSSTNKQRDPTHFCARDKKCKASITVRLGSDSTTRFRVHWCHNHAFTLRNHSMLRTSVETDERLLGYFEQGDDSLTAMKRNREFLKSAGLHEHSNAQMYPQKRHVQHLYDNFVMRKWGGHSQEEIIDRIDQYREKWESEGGRVIVSNNPFVVLVASPVMVRCWSREATRNCLFIDSTSNVEGNRLPVTIVTSLTPMGGVPVAYLITESEKTEDFTAAFRLLSDTIFAGSGPKAVMRDDCMALCNSLRNVFPTARQYVCTFHVLAYHWKWLMDPKNGIPEDKRQEVYRLIKQFIRSPDEDQSEEAFFSLMRHPHVTDELRARLQKHHKNSMSYLVCKFGRETSGHLTNNISESAVRLLKEQVLRRLRVHNVVALVAEIISRGDSVYIDRMIEFGEGRNCAPLRTAERLKKLCDYMQYITISRNDDGTFLVPSSNGESSYVVDMTDSTCTCHAGTAGSYCKHQFGLQFFFGIKSPNRPPPGSAAERHELYALAKGISPDDLSRSLFNFDQIEDDTTAAYSSTAPPSTFPPQPATCDDIGNEELSDDVLNECASKFKAIISSVVKDNNSLNKLNSALNTKNMSSIVSHIFEAAAEKPKVSRAKSIIRVQPTSIGRRTLSTSKSRVALLRGQVKKSARRPHNLNKAVLSNRPNAK